MTVTVKFFQHNNHVSLVPLFTILSP